MWQQVDLREDLCVSLMISTDCTWLFLFSSPLQMPQRVLQMPVTGGSRMVQFFSAQEDILLNVVALCIKTSLELIRTRSYKISSWHSCKYSRETSQFNQMLN